MMDAQTTEGSVTIMRLVRLLAVMASFIAVAVADIRPSAAMVIYPWCVTYGGRMGGAENCGFVTLAQCLATRQGNGGFCKPNPWYYPYPPSPRGAPPIWR
jgi:hypothetical protein